MVKIFSGQKKAGKGYTKNAVSSAGWVIGFSEMLFLSGLLGAPSLWIQVFSGCVMVALLAFYCWLVGYFAIRDPSRLQSEGYNLEVQAMNALYNETPPEEGRLKIPPQEPISIRQSKAKESAP